MTQLTVTEFRALLRTIWPLKGDHLIEPEQALLMLSSWQDYTSKKRYFYPNTSPFFAACNAGKLFNRIDVSGARRFQLYQLNERGKQFHARLGALLAGRMLAQHIAHQRTAVFRAARTLRVREIIADVERAAANGTLGDRDDAPF